MQQVSRGDLGDRRASSATIDPPNGSTSDGELAEVAQVLPRVKPSGRIVLRASADVEAAACGGHGGVTDGRGVVQ